MTVNPVFINELRQCAFRKHTRIIIATWIIIALVSCFLAQFGLSASLVIYAPIVLLPLLVPAIAAGAFAKEYEQQTWLDLTLTCLTNAQVVYGKFLAYLLQVSVALMALIPCLLFILLSEYSHRMSDLTASTMPLEWQLAAVGTTVMMTAKLLLSACLYILLVMVCSRYSANRRTAIIWSYAAIALYSMLGWLTWTLVGSLAYNNELRDQMQDSSGQFMPIELPLPGFMESFHLIFCGVVGVGSIVLLWVSLSEQRGYRASSVDDAVTRAWQPIANRPR